MDIVPIIIPPLASYIVSTHCPFKPNFDSNARIETKGEFVVRNNVWPILSGSIGFAWYFARNKAQLVEVAKKSSKGSREAVGKLAGLFKGSHKYVLDLSFLSLIILFNWWIYLYSCQGNLNDAFKVLILSVAACIFVTYLTSSYPAPRLLFVTPVL